MPAEFTFYDILGVQPSAAADEIRAAYHAAALKYHPDVNSAPNAQRLTAIINEAYATLSDPSRRSAYDATLFSGSPYAGPEDAREEIWDLYGCDGCGSIDAHLRYAMFFKVWSILVFTQMRGEGGILCPKCRSKLAISTALFSAFLGPWGFPWGIIYTLRSLFASLRGGELPKQQNMQLLCHQGVAFLQRGLAKQARMALNASLWFEKNDAVVRLLKKPVFTEKLAAAARTRATGRNTTHRSKNGANE